jgi:hypothetical protein
MVIRSEQKILDSVTDTLFSTHKLTGFTLSGWSPCASPTASCLARRRLTPD